MTSAQRILALAKRQPLVRPRDVEARGIAREALLRLFRQGLLVRQARGVYALPESPVTEHHSLAIAAKRPQGHAQIIQGIGMVGPGRYGARVVADGLVKIAAAMARQGAREETVGVVV